MERVDNYKKSKREFGRGGLMELFCILIVGPVTLVNAFIKIQRTICRKEVILLNANYTSIKIVI